MDVLVDRNGVLKAFHALHSVVGGDGAGEHLLFQLIADHDVQAVGELVGLGADQRGPGAVHHTVELLLRHVLQLGGEVLLQPRQQDGAEGPAAADERPV